MSFQDPTPPASEEPEVAPTEPTLADTDDDQEDRGRIGYGKNERTSSWMLGGVLILVVLALGVYQWTRGGDADDSPSRSTSVDVPAVGRIAPDFTLTTFTGEDITLSEQQGKVVVVNFWGSWCEPCKREMPAFQRYWESAPDDVMMIGVGGKQDPEDRSRAFAEGFGITYPIGRDAGGDGVASGSIATDYTVTFYPMTYIIGPNGVVSSLVIGEMDEDDLAAYVQKARDEANEAPSTPQAIHNRRDR